MRAFFEKHGAVANVEVTVCFHLSYVRKGKKGMEVLREFFLLNFEIAGAPKSKHFL
jgi:hypothetical protein